MVKTLILLCLSSVDPSSCDTHSAVTRIQGPEAGIEECAFSGESILAARPHAIFGSQYAKVVCQRLEARR